MLSQCSADEDFNECSEVSPSGNGDWTISSNRANVFQSENGNPTFFTSPTIERFFIVTTIFRKRIVVGLLRI